MSKEAMKLALEALEMVDRDDNDRDFLFPSQCYQLDEAITALREALAEQPAQQEPVAAECNFVGTKEWGRCSIEHHNLVQSEPHNWPGYQTRLLYTSHHPAQQQEPAFHGFMDEERCCVNICYTPWAPGGPNNELPTAYYTSPPAQRPHECSRSHPHENMDAMCELRTEIARLTNENARLKAQPAQRKPLPEGLLDCMTEAAAILSEIDPDHIPKNMRWPLADELYGFVLILKDEYGIKENT